LRCGDGVLDAGEECGEKGAGVCPANETCDSVACLCMRNDERRPFCGDGRADIGEQCNEPGLSCADSQTCDTQTCFCSGGGSCGNGRRDGGEECGEPGLSCGGSGLCDDRTCTCLPPQSIPSDAICGNGGWEIGEECDDGNLANGDGCSAYCELENGFCGDGVVQSILGEQCEEPLRSVVVPFRCVDCRFVSDFCGDGTVNPPAEECDEGPNNSNASGAPCRLDCSLSGCGDGVLDSAFGEACDDGNRRAGDGCSRECSRESPSDGFEFPGSVIELPPIIPGVRPSQPGVPSTIPETPTTGPGAIAIAAAGAAAGLAWMRRRRK
jgi:cysteine-rich repeat protein